MAIRNQLTKEQILALPPVIDLPTAGRAFGKGRTLAYELARTGEFPCQVLPLGRRFVVTKTELFKALGWALPEASMHASDPAA